MDDKPTFSYLTEIAFSVVMTAHSEDAAMRKVADMWASVARHIAEMKEPGTERLLVVSGGPIDADIHQRRA